MYNVKGGAELKGVEYLDWIFKIPGRYNLTDFFNLKEGFEILFGLVHENSKNLVLNIQFCF